MIGGGDATCANDLHDNAGAVIDAFVIATSTTNARGALSMIASSGESPSGLFPVFGLTSTSTPAGTNANASGYVTYNAAVQQSFVVTLKFDTSTNNSFTPWVGTLEILE